MNLRSSVIQFLSRQSEQMPLHVNRELEPIFALFLAEPFSSEAEKPLFEKIQKTSPFRSLAISKDWSSSELEALYEQLKPKLVVTFGDELSAKWQVLRHQSEWIASPSLIQLGGSADAKKKLWESIKSLQSRTAPPEF
jgi:hypothetical protein